MGDHACLIAGEDVPAEAGRFDIVCPSHGKPFAAAARCGKREVDTAVAAARRAHKGGDHGKTTASERGRVLGRLAQAVRDRHDQLTALEAMDCGKRTRQAAADITCLARYLQFYGGAADKEHGPQIPFLNDWLVTGIREPHGVTVQIIPWH